MSQPPLMASAVASDSFLDLLIPGRGRTTARERALTGYPGQGEGCRDSTAKRAGASSEDEAR